jgi:hypothetical protein
LFALATTCTPAFVITQAIEVLEKQKSPRTLENGLLWMQDMCAGFALKLMKPKQMLDFVTHESKARQDTPKEGYKSNL